MLVAAGFLGVSAAADTPVGASTVASGPLATDLVISLERATLIAADGGPFGLFPQSVAISGDTAVVGGGSAEDDGAAHVFVRSGDTWAEQAKLVAAESFAGDEFGISVAVSGDTAVVGATGGAVPASASAYVFVRTGTAWTQQARLDTPDVPADDFGFRVAVDGDTAVISNRISAFVFARSGTTWTEQAELTAPGSSFWAVALSSDTAVIGAPVDDTAAGADAGRAFVFARSGDTWTEQAQLTASSGGAGDSFGFAVAVTGETALVGAGFDDAAAGADVGSALVFTRSGPTWTEEAKLTASDGAALDSFGYAVALTNDTAVIGAPIDDTAAGYDVGSAYVFTRSGTTWSQRVKLTASDASPDDSFGTAVAVDDDTAVIGAPGDYGTGDGRAYVFVATPVGLALALDGAATATRGGRSVALTGTITCSAGQRFNLTVTLRQGHVRGVGKSAGACTGSPESFTVAARSTGSGRFTPGPAQACATATAGVVTARVADCRVVTIADS